MTASASSLRLVSSTCYKLFEQVHSHYTYTPIQEAAWSPKEGEVDGERVSDRDSVDTLAVTGHAASGIGWRITLCGNYIIF